MIYYDCDLAGIVLSFVCINERPILRQNPSLSMSTGVGLCHMNSVKSTGFHPVDFTSSRFYEIRMKSAGFHQRPLARYGKAYVLHSSTVVNFILAE